MRLKEDNTSWRADGIKRRDFRHDFGTPEVPKGHPKRKAKKQKVKKPKCKHVWVEVGYEEFCRYAGRHPYNWVWKYVYYDPTVPRYWTEYTTYYVCAGCLDTKSKVDEGKRRYVYYKMRRERMKGW